MRPSEGNQGQTLPRDGRAGPWGWGHVLNVVKSMEERQGKIFYYFGVIYFYCFFSFY